MTETALSVQHLSKRFSLQQERRHTFKERAVRGKGVGHREFWALRDVSFDVKKGSFFGIVGHNGSGKSTALKVIAGIYRPTSGTVAVDGRLRALLELGAGFHPELTGRQNIELNASILGMTQREIRASMDEIIEFAGIDDFIDSPVKVYSSGMAVRLGFSIAIKMDPDILIIDEILAVGDEAFQRKCYDHMFNLRRRGKTIVLVTHAVAVVENQCDEAIWLDHGEVRASGDASSVVTEYVRQVNRQEARNPVSGIDVETESAGKRRGSGEIAVRAVEILDSSGQPAAAPVSGRPYTFRIHLDAREPVRQFQAAMGFFTEQGACLAMIDDKRVQSVEAGTAHMDLTMDPFPLGDGPYLMSVLLGSEGHVYDLIDKALPLTVRPGDTQGFGLVNVPARWLDVVQTDARPTENDPTEAAVLGRHA